jgi:hypothetical protein
VRFFVVLLSFSGTAKLMLIDSPYAFEKSNMTQMKAINKNTPHGKRFSHLGIATSFIL